MRLKHYYRIIRFFLSIFLIYLVVRKIDYANLFVIMKQVRLPYVFVAFIVFFIHDMIKVIKWYILLISRNVEVPFFRLLQLDYASRFMGLLLPSSVGVDIFRGYGISKELTTVKLAASSIIIDRMLNLLSLLVISSFSALLFYKEIANPTIVYASFLLLTGVLLIIFILSSDSIENFLDHFNGFLTKNRFIYKISQLHKSIKEYKQFKKKLFSVFVLAFSTQILRILIYYSANIAVNAHITFKYCLIFTPLVILIAMLPFSLLGVGLREGSFVYFFTKVGIGYSAALSVSAIVSGMVILSIIPGGVILGVKGLVIRRAAEVQESEKKRPITFTSADECPESLVHGETAQCCNPRIESS